jgi:hypothetical protein
MRCLAGDTYRVCALAGLAEWIWCALAGLEATGLIVLAGKRYQDTYPKVSYKGKNKPQSQKDANRAMRASVAFLVLHVTLATRAGTEG